MIWTTAGMAQLVVFDVDGTLTSTTAVDAECYVQALTERLERPVDADWSTYRQVTDTGLPSRRTSAPDAMLRWLLRGRSLRFAIPRR